MDTFENFIQNIDNSDIMLTEKQELEVSLLENKIFEHLKENDFDLNSLNEGVLSRLVGGAAGFLVGPAIGRVIAKALGIEKGILYDLFNSRLVGAAIGDAIGKHIKKNN